MSGSAAAAETGTALTEAERADVRRMCGYPPHGGPDAAGFQGWRFFQDYGLLEFRMTNLIAPELQNLRMVLAECLASEQDLFTARGNLDTEAAAVWTHNPREIRDRWDDFTRKRRHLCALLGVPAGPQMGSSGSSMTLVV